ncbi:hypothetical protein WR25_20815 [Diploscapter pachys]|uniref:Uncharacterized protein n=1 Tax=Diploscapter pachys TaxID=2018661 RepID=A0A2A2LDX6_9BILA|nr:hypothetical protein WR25_20815 [Diploscapter pachys]
MVEIDKVSINMDDVFGAVQTTTVTSETHYEVPPNGSIVNSRKSTSSHVYTGHIPDEPKSRASTKASEESNASTVKHVSVAAAEHRPEPAERAAIQPMRPTNRNIYQNPTLSDSTMSYIFNSVGLQKGHARMASPAHDHNDVIGHLDDVLAGEDDGMYHADHESLASYRGIGGISSRRQSNMSANSYARFAADHEANRVVGDSFRDLNLNGHQHYDHPPSEPATDYGEIPHSELHGAVPSLGSHRRESSLSQPLSQPRIRTMTVDSTVSMGVESRIGEFNVHDEDGRFTGDEINIYHDEVAYVRPEETTIYSTEASKRQSIHTGETYNLRQLQRELTEAKRQQSLLASQVERERAEVERLKLRKQQNIAYEAAIKADQINKRQQNRAFSSSSDHSNNRSSARTTPTRTDSSSHRHTSSFSQQFHHVAPNPLDYRTYSEHSESTDSWTIDEEILKPSKVAQHQKDHGEIISCVNGVDLIVPEYVVVEGFSKNPRINKIIIGGPSSQVNPEDGKVVLLFGSVGSGKTSAVNSMLNYLYDVKRSNDFRFVLDDKPKKTTGLTAYVINNSILPFSVTIVDTPGVPNQKDDKTVSTLIKQWLEQELLESGSFRMDAISIVMRHDENQLGWPFIHELAAVKHMFGDDLKTNVLPIITNSEVNNAGFSVEPPHGITKLKHKLFFTHGMASLDNFFRDLQELIHPLIAILRNPNKRASHPKHIDTEALY